MMTMADDYADLIDRLAAAALDARAAVREVHEALADARDVTKELRAAARDAVNEDINAIVTEKVTAMGDQVEKAMRRSVEKVGREFDKLAAIYMGKGNDSLEILTRRVVDDRR
jgi:ABC-type transporter Mla subunit MlaD